MPASENGPGKTDKALGMDQSISRRDFLNSTLLASGGLLMTSVSPRQLLGKGDDWTGYGGVGDYSGSNGNTLEVLTAGHRIRDGEFDRPAANVVDTGEVYDCVIVGGGISGLAAALFFLRKSGKNRTCLVLDNHPVFRRRSQAQRVHGGRPSPDGAPGLRGFLCSISPQLSGTFLRLHRVERRRDCNIRNGRDPRRK